MNRILDHSLIKGVLRRAAIDPNQFSVLLDLFGRVDAKVLLETERDRLEAHIVRGQVTGTPLET